MQQSYPVIDCPAAGRNIQRIRKAKGLSVRDMQEWFNFAESRAIYKWQSGQSFPSADNLFALSVLPGVPIDVILICAEPREFFRGSDTSVFLFRYRVKL